MNVTGTTADVRPILFHDFNSPGEPDGTFLALFGCCGDDLVYDGVVVELDPRGLVRVAMA